MRLNEVYWTDIYPNSFKEFRKKYLPLLRAKKLAGFYVQFSDFANTTIDRNPSPVQDHSDPQGVYAYPIEYVLQYPADIWYGNDAKYMRVLESTSKNSLNLLYIDSINKCERMLRSVGFTIPEINEMMWIVNKHYKDRIKGKNKWAKMFFQCMQVDLLSDPVEIEKPGFFSKGGPRYRIRTGPEQTALFRKMKVDAILDTSRTNNNAVINPREPEQICFLTRNAFRVIEVYDLRGGMNATKIKTHMEKSLAATIAKAMDDQIIESYHDSKIQKKMDQAYRYFWTKKGRRIEITFDRPDSYYTNKTIGEKKHKEDKLSNSFRTQIEIHTEFGTIKSRFSSAEEFKNIISSIVYRWNELKENPKETDWVPQNVNSFMAKVNADKEEFYRRERQKEKEKLMKNLSSFKEEVNFVVEYYKFPKFKWNNDQTINSEIPNMLQWFANRWRQKGTRPISEIVEGWYKTCEEWLTATNQMSMMEQIHQLGNILEKIGEKHKWSIRAGAPMFGLIMSDIKEEIATK